MSDESLTSTRVIDASPTEVWALLSDPRRHHETEPSDWVREAPVSAPLSHVGQIFVVPMFLERVGGDYEMHNRVDVLEPERALAWTPGTPDDNGDWTSGGWFWRYDLAPADGGGTEVTQTYDWSRTSEETRAQFGGFPLFGVDYLDQSLAALDAALT